MRTRLRITELWADGGRLLYEGRWFDPQSLMLREPPLRWVGSAVSGTVTIRLRRATIIRLWTRDGSNLTYEPDRLSMERLRTKPSVHSIGSVSSPCVISISMTVAQNWMSIGILNSTAAMCSGWMQRGLITEPMSEQRHVVEVNRQQGLETRLSARIARPENWQDRLA